MISYRVNGLMIGLGAFIAFSLGLALMGWMQAATVHDINKRLDKPPTCVTGQFLVETDQGLLIIGDQTLCGRDLRFGPVTGPSQRTLDKPPEV